jgi:hypothetical protein
MMNICKRSINIQSVKSNPKVEVYSKPMKKLKLKPFSVPVIEKALGMGSTAELKEQSQSRMLSRDYIHDSLYNKEYGYFSKRAVIFSPPEPIEFNELRDMTDFTQKVAGMYREYDEIEEDEALQVWHTPTELYQVSCSWALSIYSPFTDERSPITFSSSGKGNILMANRSLSMKWAQGTEL